MKTEQKMQTVNNAKTSAENIPANASAKPDALTSEATIKPELQPNEQQMRKLQARIAELEQQVTAAKKEPQNIEERIAYFKQKQQLTKRFEKFNSQIAHLQALTASVEDVNETAEDFTNTRDVFRLQVIAPHLYRDEEVLSITNKVLIIEILGVLIAKMKETADRLQAEIAE